MGVKQLIAFSLLLPVMKITQYVNRSNSAVSGSPDTIRQHHWSWPRVQEMNKLGHDRIGVQLCDETRDWRARDDAAIP